MSPDNDRLWIQLDGLTNKLDTNDARLRSEMRELFNKLGSQFAGDYQKIVGRVEDHSGRLLVLEENRRINERQREETERQRNRRASLLGAITGAGASAIFGILSRMMTAWSR